VAAAVGKHVLDSASTVLTTEVLLGGGLLAVVLAALAILTTFFDEAYRAALRKAPGGFAYAVRPFKVVAWAGAASATIGIVVLILWTTFGKTGQAVALGVVSGFTVWAVAGTWQLVSATTFHGAKRAELLELERVKEFFERHSKRSA
jgi:hypothetical protein